jgi:prephenate dehydratase
MAKTVAIQGGFGAFHELAARQFFQNEAVEAVPCDTFQQVFEAVQTGQSQFGIMAIENTIAGTLLPNYSLLMDGGLDVLGEINLHIQQNLMALPGQKIEDITEVYSHPIAIQQSAVFFKSYPKMKLIEAIDTALSAKDIRDDNHFGAAAIASELAAEMYDMEIIARGVETNKRNFTRFLIIGKKQQLIDQGIWQAPQPDKATLCFTLPHEEGSLASVLSIFSFYKISLTKIQSVPIIGQEFEYFFHIDLVFADHTRYRQALRAIEPLTHNLKVFGEYARAPQIES